MIKRFIDKLLGKPPRIPLGKRVEVGPDVHGIDPTLVDERALKVVSTLKQAGYEAYIVGGAVRDLLVGRRPKDFDVATTATPEQVRQLFRRAFVIGRRFRLVHVVFGRGRDHEVIEVSTFRAYRDASEADQVEGNERTSKADLAGKTHVIDAAGRVLRDNVWGPQNEDAARRDFTVNAMYYDPETRIVVDFHRGIHDAKKRVLRMIGDPAMRYREDPVRVVRAVRFAAKLGFQIEPKTAAAMAEAIPLLANVPVSRLFDEMIKLLQTGHALASIEALRTYGLHRTNVFPVLQVVFDETRSSEAGGEQRQRFIELALADTDRRVQEGRAVVPSFLLACLLWHEARTRWEELQRRGEPPIPALQQAIDGVFDARIGDVSGRGRLAADMREIWLMQPRFERRQTTSALALVAQPRFRAGFDFLRLRADAQEIDPELAEWWEDFSLGDADEREALLQLAREAERTRRHGEPAASLPAAATKKRRRRRRGGGGMREAADVASDAPAPPER